MKNLNNNPNNNKNLFDNLINSILEANIASSGGSFGSSSVIGNKGGSVGNDDFYAKGDTRIPFSIMNKRKKKNKHNKKDKEIVIVQRRPKIKM